MGRFHRAIIIISRKVLLKKREKNEVKSGNEGDVRDRNTVKQS